MNTPTSILEQRHPTPDGTVLDEIEPHNLLRAGLESAFRKCFLVQSYGEIDSILSESQQSISSVI